MITTIMAWLVFSLIVAAIGNGRRIGGLMAFVASLLLSPLVGLIIVLFSKSLVEAARERQFAQMQQQHAEMMKQLSQQQRQATTSPRAGSSSV